MTGEAATAFATIKTLQFALSILSQADLTAFQYPVSKTITNGTTYDYVVVGGGMAGSVVAGRLCENSSVSVLLIEAGYYAPIESDLSGIFTMLPNSASDWNLTAVNDNYSAQLSQNEKVPLTVGKMVGGSSGLHHTIYTQGVSADYQLWAQAANDSSWNYDSLLPYFKLIENLQDETILNSTAKQYHGTSGAIGLTREISSDNDELLAAYEEMGIPVVDDSTGKLTCAGEPLYMISDNMRQSAARGYLTPAASRSNLYLATKTLVNKLYFDSSNAVTGVEVIDSDGNTLVVHANKEVIITAGALYTPGILMRSGVGPSALLSSLDIPLVSDQKVGEGLHDHTSATFIWALEENNASAPASNPYKFPVPTTTVYVDYDKDGQFPDYQAINLMFPHDSSGFLQLCLNVFQFKIDFCQKIYTEGTGRNIINVVMNIMHPKSYGSVTINSIEPTAAPVVNLGIYSDKTDLVNMGLYLADLYDTLINTTYYKKIGGKMLTLDLCPDYTFGSAEYWQCFALETSSTMWHYSGTCPLGTVLDSKLQVNGVSNVRVCDAAAMPNVISGNIGSAVMVIAEKCAALIKETW